MDETLLVNQIATYERSIAGVKNSFSYAQNPDSLPNAALPAVIHYCPSFTAEPRAHFNVWSNKIVVKSILFVAPRQSQGGKIKYLENAAIPFGQLWRAKFQDSTVISALLSATGGVKVFLESGEYGVGGNLLTFADVPFIGFVFSFSAQSA